MTGRRQFGNIRRRANGKWQATYKMGGKRISLGVFKSKSAASAALSNVESDLSAGSWIDPTSGRISFEEYSWTWLKNRTNLRPRTRDQYSSLLRCHLVPRFGPQHISQISPHEVRGWFADIQSTVPGSSRSAYRLLRAVFNTAVLDGVIRQNPCRVKGAGTDRSKERPLLTLEEAQVLYIAMPEHIRVAVLLAAWGTLRRGEVLGLQRGDVNVENCSVVIKRSLVEPSNGILAYGPTKNGDQRTIHFSELEMTLIEAHLAAFVGPEPEAPLFTGRTGGALRPGSFWHMWDKARKSTGITGYHFHDLRHYAATTFSAAGASTRELMDRGGWRSTAIAVRYQHATSQRDAELAKSLPPLLPTGRPEQDPLGTKSFEIGLEQEGSSGGETRTLNLAGPLGRALVPALTRIVPAKYLSGHTARNRPRPQLSDRSRADRARHLTSLKEPPIHSRSKFSG
jgi:integrase